MGSTVTCGKLAAAFKAPDGETVWAMYENTYEKNCYPHTPHWSCIYLGDFQGAMRKAFRYAASCEGGMLQGRGGNLTPEGYICGWLKEFANPMSLRDTHITLRVGTGLYTPIQPDQTEAAYSVLIQHGRADAVETLKRDEKVVCRLHADAKLLTALIRDVHVPPWRILENYTLPLYAERAPDLGYNPVRRDCGLNTPEARKVDAHEYIIRGVDGAWRAAGWAYGIVGDFVTESADTEIAFPGSYKKRIRTFRDAIATAPSLPAGTRVSVYEGMLEKRWDIDRAATLKQHPSMTTAAAGFEVAAEPDILYDLCALPREAATWLLPAEPQGKQLELMAATSSN